MKKSLFILISLFCLKGFSQSMLLTNIATSATISPNMVIEATTAATTTTDHNFDVKNISGSTKVYDVKRYDVVLNTAGTGTNLTMADAHFCFASQCYGSNVTTSLQSLTLTSMQSASQSTVQYMVLTSDLDECYDVGYSLVKYTVYNSTTPSDSIQFSIKFNGPLALNESAANVLSSLELYPNPATSSTVLKVNSVKAMDAKVIIYNALGAVVSEKPVSIAEGKNKIDLNVEELNAGIYFTQIKMANSSVTKRLIVK